MENLEVKETVAAEKIEAVPTVEVVAETVENAAETPVPAAPVAERAPRPERPAGERTERPAGDRPERPNFRNRRRRKVCQFCTAKVQSIDYKDTAKLRNLISERGKILPRRMTGTCAPHQRALGTAIKRARQIALLPYIAE